MGCDVISGIARQIRIDFPPYFCYCEGKLAGKLCLIDVLLRVVLMQSKQTLIKLKLWIRPEFRHFQERRESLSIKLFEDIVSNEHHKLANLLPPMASSHARRLRNKRRFNTPVCRTDRFMNSFFISHAM